MAKKKSKEPVTLADLPRLALKFITSFGLAAVVLTLMTITTLFGTLNQKEEGLYDSQKAYFESAFVADTVMGVPVFLPGGYLLMAILFLNMTFGMLLKIRKSRKAIGLHISHFGMLFLIVSSFVTKHFSWEGNMTLYPGNVSTEVKSYHDWQLEILPIEENGLAPKAQVIPHEDFRQANGDREITVVSDDLPFDVVVEDFERNALPIPSSVPIAQNAKKPTVNGHVLLPQALEKEAEGNFPGVYTRIVPKDGSDEQRAIIWAHVAIPTGKGFSEPTPWAFEVGDQQYAMQLVRKRYPVPFEVRLDEFILETHPGTTKARNYQSNITYSDSGMDEIYEIKMNEPLRHSGFTFFQSKYGPTDPGPGEEYYTVFAVVKNPADHWPLYSLIITGVGLFIHFIMKLGSHLKRPARKKEAAPVASSPVTT